MYSRFPRARRNNNDETGDDKPKTQKFDYSELEASLDPNDQVKHEPVLIGTYYSPYGNFPIKHVAEKGHIESNTTFRTGVDEETFKIVRLNNLPRAAEVKPEAIAVDARGYGQIPNVPNGFYHDYDFDFTRYRNESKAQPPYFRANARARWNTSENVEDLNPAPIVPCLVTEGKQGEFNLAKMVFSLAPFPDGNFHVILKKFLGTPVVLDRADLSFAPDEMDEAIGVFRQLLPLLPESRYKLIDSFLNPTAYTNPNRRGSAPRARLPRAPRRKY